MSVFVDTSGILVVLDGSAPEHERAVTSWNAYQEQEELLVTTNYVVVESMALIQNRLGLAAVRVLHERIMPVLTIEWITSQQHVEAMSALLAANQRRLSLVDCCSFITMRRLNISIAFALDKHFREQGFTCQP